MIKQKNNVGDKTNNISTRGKKYLEGLHIGKSSFDYLSSAKGRIGSRGKTKSKSRLTDGIKYPCIIIRPAKKKVDEETTNE